MPRLFNQNERTFRTVHAQIHGFQQCCSAAILHGVNGYARTNRWPVAAPASLQAMDQTPVDSFRDWMKQRAEKCSVFELPYDYAMCVVLEILYNKAKHGEGGNNMYASPRYATKTWFIADRKRTDGSMSCLNFMLWLKDQGVSKVGRIHISPYRPGAHGGYCKGGVYAPDLPKVRKFLDERLQELNDYAEFVFEEYKITRAPGEEYYADEVAAKW